MLIRIALLMLLILYGGYSTGIVENSEVHGRVTNSLGYPLANVFVWANLESISWAEHGVSDIGMAKNITVTDSNGFYSMNLRYGYYEMYAADDSVAVQSGILIKVDDEMREVDLINDGIPVGYGSLQGLVVDNLDLPVIGAEVSTLFEENVFDMTDNNGFYQIQELTPGFHIIGASGSRHLSATSDSVWIEPGTTTVCNFDETSGRCLRATTGCISGEVETSDGRIFDRFTPTIVVVGTSRVVEADSQGVYLIRFLEEGDYTLQARICGYRPRTSPKIHVSSGDRVEFNFTVDNANPNDPAGYALTPDFCSLNYSWNRFGLIYLCQLR